jgi:hypothetical protein
VDLGDLLHHVGAPTLGGLLGLVVLAVLTGRLVPVATLLRELESADRRAEDYKAAAEAAGLRADKQAEQLDLLLTSMRASEQALLALRTLAERGRH